MAYNHNGQGYYGQYSSSQNHQEQFSHQENYAHLPQPNIRRTSSFDAGDDRAQVGSEQNASYQPVGNPGTQHQQLYTGAPAAVMRNGSNSSARSGTYQMQGPLPPVPSPLSAYNPQEYARPTAPYAPQIYSSAAPSPNPGYQPYVPAAYHAGSLPHQPGYGYQVQENYPNSHPAPLPHQALAHPPPIPLRPYEQPYGRRLSQSSTSRYSDSYRNSPRPQMPGSSPHASAYTPPAPPPPPFSPGRDAFPAEIQPASPIRPLNTFTSQSPYPQHEPSRQPTIHQLPPLPNYTGTNEHVNHASPIRQPSYPWSSPGTALPSSPPPIPPQHSPQRTNTTGQHPTARPLPGPPTPDQTNTDYFRSHVGPVQEGDDQQSGYDDIMKELEAAVMGRAPSTTASRTSPRIGRLPHQPQINEEEEPQPLFSSASHSITPDSTYNNANGISATNSGIDVNYGAYSDESDAEAAAGLAAMQMAEEQEAADNARRYSGNTAVQSLYGSQRSARIEEKPEELSSDSDVPVDMDTYGGTFSGQLNYHYGNELSSPPNATNALDRRYQTSAQDLLRSSATSDEVLQMPEADYFMANEESIHPFPSFGARVDTGGTGGLSEPGAQQRRLSFEDGDEATLVDYDMSAAPSPAKDPMFYNSSYPARTTSRPLPQVPGLNTTDFYRSQRQVDQSARPTYPVAPDEYEQGYTPSGTPVQKANSIGSHSTTPLVVPPGRSITDAEQRRRYQQLSGTRTNTSYDLNSAPDPSLVNSGKLGDIDLPSIPAGKRRRFIPSKLSTSDFKNCTEPWALSSILAWIREMTEGESDLKEHAVIDGIVALFTHKVPTMNTADAEVISAWVVRSMFEAGALIKEEEWVKLGTNPVSGVLYQLTGTGCYSSRVHTSTLPGRCYSRHCMRTLKKINLQIQTLQPERRVDDWVTFYKLKKEDIEGRKKTEIERQNILHEIVTGEELFIDSLNVLLILYREGLAKSPVAIIPPKKLDGFLADVFGNVEAVKIANEGNLLAGLKWRQQEEGPWIKGFSDIFREWIRKARDSYVAYAAKLPNALILVRREADRNAMFRQFLDETQENVSSKRLGWDHYLKAPITRLQRYNLLLSVVDKNTPDDDPEKSNLLKAMEEVKAVTYECDARVAENTKQAELADLGRRLKLRPGMEKVQLNLTHLGREIIFQGDLQRKGNNKVTWLETQAILFDHYLVLAKSIQQRDTAGGSKHEAFDVSKLPIPMDLLVLESTNDEPVVKTAVKGIASMSTVTSRAQTPQEARLGRTVSSQTTGTGGPGTLSHTSTSSSTVSTVTNGSSRTLMTTTAVDSSNEKVMYPFRVKHLGKTDVYVLYAPSAQNRQDWCEKIILAKERHAASLMQQNAEPFRLRVVADTAFSYDSMSGGQRSTIIRGTPLDRAIRDVEKRFDGLSPRPPPICRATVNCATAFQQPFGKHMIAIGTDFGVFISDYDNPRGWTKAISATRVTQIAVLEEFSVFLVISDRSLIAHHLDVVCPAGGAPNPTSDASGRRAPQKLSGNRDVGFFAHRRMKDRTLVFYKKREGISSTFKVLEPVHHRSATSTRSRFGIRKGTTEFFRDFDDFYIPAETYTINLFQSSLAIATARGFEVLTLDKKVPFSIPDLRAPEVASIAARIQAQKPLGMFRLSDNEFLLVFEEVGIYVNKYGEVSRAVVLEFVGRARQAVLYGSMYLILVDTNAGFVEVRNAVNGRLRQVVSGKDVRLLDDGANGGTVKICMQHPELERSQVVLEMIVNEGLKE